MRGSPAPAGIDPPPKAEATVEKRLPRTRGDRPVAVAGAKDRRKAPPHPRG